MFSSCQVFLIYISLFFLPFIKVILSKLSLTCQLKTSLVLLTAGWMGKTGRSCVTKKLLVTTTADSYRTKHSRVLSSHPLSWAGFKDHQPLVCMTLIWPIKAVQGHAVTFPWCQCETSVLACPSLQTRPSVFPCHCLILVNLHRIEAALLFSKLFANCLNYLLISQCFHILLPTYFSHFATWLKICILGNIMIGDPPVRTGGPVLKEAHGCRRRTCSCQCRFAYHISASVSGGLLMVFF